MIEYEDVLCKCISPVVRVKKYQRIIQAVLVKVCMWDLTPDTTCCLWELRNLIPSTRLSSWLAFKQRLQTCYRWATSSWTQCEWKQESCASRQVRSPESSWTWLSTSSYLVGTDKKKLRHNKWGVYFQSACLVTATHTHTHTIHDGGISLLWIKWTLSFSILCFIFQSQLSIRVGL